MRTIAILLIGLQTMPAFGLSPTIEIVKVGRFSDKASSAFPKIEQSLQKAFENNMHGTARIITNGTRVTEAEYQSLLDEESLLVYTKKLRDEILTADELTHLHRLQDKLEKLGTGGNLLQETTFLEAYSAWKHKDKRTAERLVSKALSLHPEGVGEFGGSWGEVEGQDVEGTTFNVLVDSKRSRITRACEVTVSGLNSKESVYVNGFWLSYQPSFHFQTGRIYRVSRGPSFEPVLVSCGGLGSIRASLPLAETPKIEWERLVARANALLFIRETKGVIEIDSFSSGKPVRTSAIQYHLQNETWKGLGAQDLEEFISYHRLGTLDLAVAELPKVNPQPAPSLMEQGSTAWYNTWVFWTITGVVAAGGITYLLTRDHAGPGVGTTSNGIKISLE